MSQNQIKNRLSYIPIVLAISVASLMNYGVSFETICMGILSVVIIPVCIYLFIWAISYTVCVWSCIRHRIWIVTMTGKNGETRQIPFARVLFNMFGFWSLGIGGLAFLYWYWF